jgi:hypothetical protein
MIIKKPLFFAPLVPEVLNDYRLSPFDRMLLSVIINLSRNSGFCFANNKHLALNLRCSEGAVSKSINKMHKLGYILDNIPNQDNGGRGYLRSVRDDIIYKSDSQNEEGSLVK